MTAFLKNLSVLLGILGSFKKARQDAAMYGIISGQKDKK
jgi:hypothetical protein